MLESPQINEATQVKTRVLGPAWPTGTAGIVHFGPERMRMLDSLEGTMKKS